MCRSRQCDTCEPENSLGRAGPGGVRRLLLLLVCGAAPAAAPGSAVFLRGKLLRSRGWLPLLSQFFENL